MESSDTINSSESPDSSDEIKKVEVGVEVEEVNECNICFENINAKEIQKLNCCKGKKWCAICEIKIRDVVYPKIPRCPFCRKNLLRIDTDIPARYMSNRSNRSSRSSRSYMTDNSRRYSSPRTPVNSMIRQVSPEPLSPELSPIENKGYFNIMHPYENNINVPNTGVNVYSFSLNPESYQPSGRFNVSRIDSVNVDNIITRDIKRSSHNSINNINNINNNSINDRRITRNIINTNSPEPYHNMGDINYSPFRISAPLIRRQNSINNINNTNNINNLFNNSVDNSFNNYINFRDDMFNIS